MRIENFARLGVDCIRCGKALSLRRDYEEHLRSARCCGLVYREEVAAIDLVVEDENDDEDTP